MENKAGALPQALKPQILADVVRESLQKGLPATLTVTSKSMTPLLWPGDQVILTAVPPTGLQFGDVITYFNGSHLITHRYWREDSGMLIVSGDRPIQFDAPVRPEQVIGRVQGRRRNNRILWLDMGSGAWLNERLARLGMSEHQKFTHVEGAVELSRSQKVKRRLTLAWAFFLCGLVNLTARKSNVDINLG